MQKDFNLFGRDSFSYEVLELCEEKALNERETYFISTEKDPYNIRTKIIDKVDVGNTVTKTIRLEPGLINKVKALADKESRNFNNMVVRILEEKVAAKEAEREGER